MVSYSFSFTCLSTLVSIVLVCFSAHLITCDAQKLVNPVRKRIIRGKRRIIVQRFAQLPKYPADSLKKYPKIVSLIPFKDFLFVCTSSSGGLIYKVSYKAEVSLWFNVSEAVYTATNRFVDISNGIHGGVRSVAFHPDFDENGRFYVSLMENRNRQWFKTFEYFSRPIWVRPADSVLLEFRADTKTLQPIPDSYRQVFRVGMKVYDHPIKQMQFYGKYLYIAHGDGSVQNGTTGGGQNNDALGKILRIDPLPTKDGKAYSIPPDNPFVKNKKYLPGIYALGFRNPHNLCFSKDGTLFVIDAGRDNVEEVNIIESGGDYGWPKREGQFVHRLIGGLMTGVSKLPRSDARNGFIYPAATVGHRGPVGAIYVGQSLAGACPIENGSPLDGLLLYANFPSDGKVYYSHIDDLKKAVTKGNPRKLTRATTYRGTLLFDSDGPGPRKARKIQDLRSILRRDKLFENAERVDMRFGYGKYGEIYWTSKRNGGIYLITTSIPTDKLGLFNLTEKSLE